jgi:hypothetical protein
MYMLHWWNDCEVYEEVPGSNFELVTGKNHQDKARFTYTTPIGFGRGKARPGIFPLNV